MRIGIDGRAAKWYRGTGIGTYTHELIRSLNAIDNTNKYLIFMPKCDSLNNLNNNFSIQNVESNETYDNFWDEIKVPNILNNSDMEIYHVPQNGIGISENINCKKVITLHDIIPLRMPETVSDRYLRIFNDELPGILKSCDGIITVSEFSKNDIAKEFNFPKENIYVTPLAAEEIYRPLSKCQCKKIISEKYHIDDNFILYVGGFSPRKNILGLIDAYSKLPYSTIEKTKLVVIGKKGQSYFKYKERAEKLGVSSNVIFTGFIALEDMPLFYNATEVLVYPSFYEGFGLPPLECMACGTPVIVSNVTSLPEVCYESALLIDPNNIDELSYDIQRVLENSVLKLTMVNKSLKRSSKYSWNKTAYETINAYKSILIENKTSTK
ncbi:glycosyltransferase family 4 protein [Clostridium botulinum]|uniref:Glycosyltransferase family 4 protein n=1 Tax=Clostridium botulinum TaxID=1491 RepID=A0A6B4JNK4_CLOBO|nr:glycosyltransferase family 1 protein [Clostridium botulinum]EES48745.1 mannosyltransferase B [Clostridium botulinum E1 str. 'BoNT E Beluga']MBY6762032.1 glycosyltransferase family 4 protein [Clostridium botulinum]MBY6920655.1 glycosyltransferase family 4 protein [Clostridium botulinum]MCR1131629.1 glycosyltransferase family 4 protein [Clostridium botulinum]NFH70390.1 glycosyltransferase family 4 protein [Clostridium botulinum]